MYILTVAVDGKQLGYLFRTRKGVASIIAECNVETWRLWDCDPRGGWCDSSGPHTGIENVPWEVNTSYMRD